MIKYDRDFLKAANRGSQHTLNTAAQKLGPRTLSLRFARALLINILDSFELYTIGKSRIFSTRVCQKESDMIKNINLTTVFL